MNKVILVGNLTRDPETRYSQSADPVAICRFSLAVNKRIKREGEPDADFINCVALGKTGEFVDKYFRKGKKIAIVGRLSVRPYEDQGGQKRSWTEVVVEEAHFTESKSSSEGGNRGPSPDSDEYYTDIAVSQDRSFSKSSSDEAATGRGGFSAIDESLDDEELPF